MASIRTYETTAGERRYLVRWRDDRQKERSKGGFRRKRHAEKFAADLHQRKQMGQLYEAPAETLGDFLDAWLERYRQRVRASTHRRRVEALRVLPDSLGSTALPSLRAADLEDAIALVGARAPRQGQLALATVKLALKDARKRGQTFDAAILELLPPRSRERQPRFLTWPEVEKLASFLPDAEARLVMVAALTGLRQGELFALKKGDVDLKARTLVVREGKTDAARRVVDLAPLAVKLLREQNGAGTLVFAAPSGGPHRADNFMHRLFRPAVKAAGLDGVAFHDLRHSFASLLIAANVNPKMGAALMGHADGGALFLRRYSHLYPGAGREAAAALQRIVGKSQRAARRDKPVASVRTTAGAA